MRLFFIAMFSILIIVSTASGQKINDLNFFFSGGLSVPSGGNDFSENWKGDVGIGGGLSYCFSPEFFILAGIDVNSFKFSPKKSLLVDETINVDGNPTMIVTLSGNIKYLITGANSSSRGSIAPYLVGGFGLFYRSVPRMTTAFIQNSKVSSTTTKFTDESAIHTSFGVGIEIPGGGLPGVFLEGRYAIGFTQDQATYYVPIRIGFRGDF